MISIYTMLDSIVQSGAAGFDTGKGEKLSNSQADCLARVAA